MHYWVIPSEKTEEKKPYPLKICFFAWNLITGLIIDDLGHFWPPGPHLCKVRESGRIFPCSFAALHADLRKYGIFPVL